MPKKKGRSNRGKAAAAADVPDEEPAAYNNDDASIVSTVSSDSYIKDADGLLGGSSVSGQAADETQEELSPDDLFEEKLRDFIDRCTEKSAATRVRGLTSICTAFAQRFIPDFVEANKMTILDLVERSLKKGKPEEQVVAAHLSVMLCIQLRGQPLSDALYNATRPLLTIIVNDRSCALSSRVAAANALGVLCFLNCSAIVDSEAVMEVLHKSFSSVPTEGESASLCSAAVSSWSLLTTVLPSSRVFALFLENRRLFARLLDAPDVDLRIATGEAIAVLYEFIAQDESDEADSAEGVSEAVEEIIPKLRQLSTDSHKYRSKKDRKEQKQTFRDILRTIEEDEGFYEKVAISRQERLEIESWSQKKQYEAICKVLGSGMNLHLAENELIRSIFEMGPRIATEVVSRSKPSKSERNFANQQASKWLTLTRGKHRDKRSVVV